MSDGDYSQSEDTELKITSVWGGCSDLHDDLPEKHEPKEEPIPEASEARDRLFTEMEKADPEKITENISSLSLGVSLDEMVILRRIFEKS